jgi:hypothetical protein
MGRFGSDRKRRRRRAQALYRFEMALREEGDISDFVYDEKQDLFRFPDGRFAFSIGVGGRRSPPGARLLRMSTPGVLVEDVRG